MSPIERTLAAWDRGDFGVGEPTYCVERCLDAHATPREYAPLWENLPEEELIGKLHERGKTPDSRQGVRITRSDGKRCVVSPYGEIVVSE